MNNQATHYLSVNLLSDVYDTTDTAQITFLALLDDSKAFDTVNYDILIRHLLVSFKISGKLSSPPVVL